jgi:hypothetical protein
VVAGGVAGRLLKTDPNIERDSVIDKHCKSTEATVLISPSLHLGLDLKDSLSRFQVLVKVPYANLGDRWLKARYDRPGGQRWYNWVTTLKLVQAYGRSIRSETDWAHTVCLDSGLGYFVKQNKHILPNWFTEAIQWSGLPTTATIPQVSNTNNTSEKDTEEEKEYAMKEYEIEQKIDDEGYHVCSIPCQKGKDSYGYPCCSHKCAPLHYQECDCECHNKDECPNTDGCDCDCHTLGYWCYALGIDGPDGPTHSKFGSANPYR